MKEQLE
jgi:hypothetical protein